MVDDFILLLSLPPKIAADLKDSNQWPCCHVFGTFRIMALRFSAVTYSFRIIKFSVEAEPACAGGA
jgi:hypothetical protein